MFAILRKVWLLHILKLSIGIGWILLNSLKAVRGQNRYLNNESKTPAECPTTTDCIKIATIVKIETNENKTTPINISNEFKLILKLRL